MSREFKGTIADWDFLVVDTETTGLRITDRPVEIAAVRLSGGETVGSMDSLVSPGIPIPPGATEIHGITDADVADAPSAAEVLPRLAALGAGAIWLAHNSGYDAGILGMAWLAAGLDAPTEPMLDTCRLARATIRGRRSYALGALGRELGLAKDGYHRALADAEVAAGLFLKSVARIGPAGEVRLAEVVRRAGGYISIAGVVAAAANPPAGFEELQAAIAEGRHARLLYRAGEDGERTLLVNPKVMFRSEDHTYLEAFDLEGRYLKSDRLDRVASFEVL